MSDNRERNPKCPDGGDHLFSHLMYRPWLTTFEFMVRNFNKPHKPPCIEALICLRCGEVKEEVFNDDKEVTW